MPPSVIYDSAVMIIQVIRVSELLAYPIARRYKIPEAEIAEVYHRIVKTHTITVKKSLTANDFFTVMSDKNGIVSF